MDEQKEVLYEALAKIGMMVTESVCRISDMLEVNRNESFELFARMMMYESNDCDLSHLKVDEVENG